MLRKIRKILFKIRVILASEHGRYAVFAKELGVKFGTNVRMTGIPSFGSEPYLISIGNDVTITHGVIFHNHDGGVGVLRFKHKGIDVIKPIKVGDNVFIGSNSTIMPGVTIGNNVVIGASSVVTRDIPDNVIVAGVPAKVIKTLQEYEEKVLKEAIFIKNRDDQDARREEILTVLGLKKV